MHPTVGRQPSIVKILRAFKTELDDEARKAMFPQNERLKG